MARLKRRTMVAAAGAMSGTAAAVAGLVGQAWWAVTRPYPSFVDLDCSGIDGAGEPVVRLAACGDSTLTGPGLDHPRDVWIRQAAAVVADELAITIDTRIVAVGGSRASDVLADQVPFLEEVRPDVTVLAVGANDVLRRTSGRAFRAAHAEVIDRLLGCSGQVVVAGIGDLGAIPRLQPPLSTVVRWRARRINRIIRRNATAAGARVHFADVARADKVLDEATADVFGPDRFHVSAVGHQAWSAAAQPPLQEAVAAMVHPIVNR